MTVVCFGEMLLRLAPAGPSPLKLADALTVHVAGAEANVAMSLAALGSHTRMATVIPENALGDRALSALMKQGVDVATCRRSPGRMALYFIESPRAGRAGGFFYDRADSAFARSVSDLDWETALEDATWLHLSGLSAALGARAVDAMRRAVHVAQRNDVLISFDCNYRPLLWEGREDEAARLLREFAGFAQLLFATDWDIHLLLAGEGNAAALLKALPQLRWVAATQRCDTESVETLGATLIGRTVASRIAPTPITKYVDRIGAGDAFAAALIHALAKDWDDQCALGFAHRACLLKHSIAGDYSTLSEAEIYAAMMGTA